VRRARGFVSTGGDDDLFRSGFFGVDDLLLSFFGDRTRASGPPRRGHDTWHESFYSKLTRNDNKTSCCNLADCSPTTSRMVDDHYEVLVEGEWTRVPKATIKNVTAPDGGAHVCAPKQQGAQKGILFCVVLPPES
jgi:hypothetical protein